MADNISKLQISHNSEMPDICLLTESQKGIYLECINNPESVMYNIPVMCELPKGTETARFISAVQTVIKKHKIMQMTVSASDGEPKMIYKEHKIEISEKTTEDIEKEIFEFTKPFDLENGPLYRFEICRTPNGDVFVFDIHHIIFDGMSVKLFISQIAQAYKGEEITEETLTISDVQKAEALRKIGDDYIKDKNYFEEKFNDVDTDTKPASDCVLNQIQTNACDKIKMSTSEQFSASDVMKFTLENKISENALFMGAFAYTLAKFSGTPSSFFCTAHHGRDDRRLHSAFGMFVRTIPMYVPIDENMKVTDFLTSVYNNYYETRHRDKVSFGELAALYNVKTDISFVYQSNIFGGAKIENGTVKPEFVGTCENAFDMDVMVIKNGDDYDLLSHFKKTVYSNELVYSLLRMMKNVIKNMLSANTLHDIALTDSEALNEIEALNKTEASYETQKTVVDLFREQAKKTPDNICLVYNDKRFTYREVDEITDRLAAHLVKHGVGSEKIVGILIPRCEYMLICSLGVLKAGGAYMPLDSTYPPERLNLMVEDSGAMMLIEAPEFSDIIIPEYTGFRMSTEDILKLPTKTVSLPTPKPSDLFVLLYTSGSTGKPKGVMHEHGNMMVTNEWVKKYFKFDSETHLAQYASYGFDAHAFDIYPAITSGAQLHIIPEEMRLDFLALRDYFNKNKITHTVMTMQIGRQFVGLGGFDTLRHVSLAGEKMTPIDVPNGICVYNLYGPSEASIVTSAFRVENGYKDVPIGKAVDNLKVYVVDKEGRLLPTGGVGELWVAGPHVTRAYLNNPEKTSQAYGLNPFSKQEGYERIYKTGDVVRLMSDGNMQFIGRRDAQVKVRGFRVELTEIEEVIRRFPNVSDVTVAAFDDPAGGKFIAAYIVSDKTVSKEKLAEFIRDEKPPYMVPAVIMQIDEIPLTQNQKVNKRALPVPEYDFGKIIPPETEMQQRIFDVIADVIGHRNFGINTDIYDAGLTSIGAVKLNVEISKAFNVPIRISDLKKNSTVEKMEKFLSDSVPEESFEIQEDYPITKTQSGIFVECMASPNTTIYNIPVLLELGENVDIARLADAIKSTIHAHPYVKTKLFTDSDGNVRARRLDNDDVNISINKCEKLPDYSELIRPFDLLNEPLYRISVWETPSEKYLFMDFHHIICDGVSETVLFRDIDEAYAGKSPKKESFTGYEAALSEEKTDSAAAREYWKNLLLGCETDCMPKKEEEAEYGTGTFTYHANDDVSDVFAFCDKFGVSANALFNAAFAFVLSRFAGKESVTYATVYNGRNDSRLSDAVTMLVKTLPVTASFTDDTKTLAFIKDMQNQLVGSMTNDACSFSELAHEYDVKADIMFIYQGDTFRFDTLCGETVKMINLPSETAKAPISINVNLVENKFEYVVEYRKNQFSKGFAEAISDAISTAVKSFIKTEAVKDVTILSDYGKNLYKILNDNDIEVEKLSCHQFFERCAENTPDAPAITSNGKTLSFGELNKSANTMANALRNYCKNPDSIIGMVLDRSCEIPMTQIAIMKAGGAFLPILPDYPDERIEYCLKDADCRCVITTEAIKSERANLFADQKAYKTLTVEELLSGNSTENPNVEILPNQLAYCIYTSGSTGNPKGVMIEHHNFTNCLAAHWEIASAYYGTDSKGASLATCSVSFDASIMDIFLPICSGHHLCMCTEEEHHNPLELRDLMLKYNVQTMVGTPSFMSNLVSIPELSDAIGQIRSIIIGAEVFPGALYDGLRKCNPDMQIINGYGPTECTICSCTKELHSNKNITIGKSVGNFKQFVLDKFGHILPPYGIGELVICGEGVGRGYVNLPEKTAAAFFNFEGMPAYRSGDLVRLNGDGEIDFGGRKDNQVKLRGFRIELDEIEKAICDYETVRQSKVIVRNNGTEDYLAGFFTASETVDLDKLTAYLKSRLTYYMVPQALLQLEQMPMTPNGKIDKKALPEVRKTERKAGRRAPKKSLEQRLCEMYASILDLEEVFADDNFFELGGTSLTASKVTMLLMSENIEVKYGDIFDNPTPEDLAAFIEQRNDAKKEVEKKDDLNGQANTHPVLKYNSIKYAAKVKREKLGNVLLTGAVGFLGIHVLKELLEIEDGHIYCLVRRGSHESAEIRLKTLLIYYFSNGFTEELRDRITVMEADITDKSLGDALKDIKIDTIINCAACVKHFSDSNILEEINVHGVENLIEICRKRDIKLIQVSTVSIPGIHTKESYENQLRMHENELFVIDDMDNKYTISKYHAELRMLDAIEKGMRGKIIRVGNLMGRQSDGEFQVNMETNMFLKGIRGFSIMGKYPISHMTDPMSFSPVDCSARAVVLLAGTNDEFTAFNANTRYGFDEMKIIDACNRNGISIYPEDDEVYYAQFREKLGDEVINEGLSGLAAYDIKDAHAVETDNLFTTNILYRIGFSWPLVDDTYLDRAINSIMTLDYFNTEDWKEAGSDEI